MLRSGLHPELKDRLRAALLTIGADQHTPSTLTGFGLKRFSLSPMGTTPPKSRLYGYASVR